jgi:hypothetical protein
MPKICLFNTGDDKKCPICQFNTGYDTKCHVYYQFNDGDNIKCPIYVSLIPGMIQNAQNMSVQYPG